MSAPADTPHGTPPLAVSMVTRFRSTSSRAQSQRRRSTSRASGSASRLLSSSRAASKRMACSRSSSVPPAPKCLLSCQRPLTLMLAHHPRSAPRTQSPLQPDRRPGRHSACRGPQGQLDAAVAQVGCLGTRTDPPSVRLCVTRPADTRHRPLIAVCSTTRSAKARMLLCPPPSRCRRS